MLTNIFILEQRKLQSILDAQEPVGNAEHTTEELQRQRAVRQRMDIDDSDIVVAGANPIRISRKQVQFFVLLLNLAVAARFNVLVATAF